MCITYKANAPAILHRDSPAFTISFIYHCETSKLPETSAGKDIQKYASYNILAVQLELVKDRLEKIYFLCFLML